MATTTRYNEGMESLLSFRSRKRLWVLTLWSKCSINVFQNNWITEQIVGWCSGGGAMCNGSCGRILQEFLQLFLEFLFKIRYSFSQLDNWTLAYLVKPRVSQAWPFNPNTQGLQETVSGNDFWKRKLSSLVMETAGNDKYVLSINLNNGLWRFLRQNHVAASISFRVWSICFQFRWPAFLSTDNSLFLVVLGNQQSLAELTISSRLGWDLPKSSQKQWKTSP